MATTERFSEGDRVRFTVPNLGALAISPEHGRPYFVDRHYGPQDEGIIVNTELPDGWIAVLPDEREPEVLYVPVHPGMIEAA